MSGIRSELRLAAESRRVARLRSVFFVGVFSLCGGRQFYKTTKRVCVFAVLPCLGVSAVRSRWLCWKSSWWFPATTTRSHSNTLFSLKRSSVPSHLDSFIIIIRTTFLELEIADVCEAPPRCNRGRVECFGVFVFSVKNTAGLLVT